MSGNRVKVGVKIRPLISHEVDSGAEPVVKKEAKRVRVSVPAKNNSFEFDWTYGPSDSSDAVYVNTCQPLVDTFMEGFNATVFAYGQTGSGKTYTMGNDGSASSEGIIPRAVTDIFQKCAELEAAGTKTSLQFSYMEVYKEECFDLLSSEKKKCDIREAVNGETLVEGLTHETVTSEQEVQDLLVRVSLVRTTAKTAMNSVSSRSHAICTFTLTTTKQETLSETEGTTTAVVSKSRFHLVDLAGSERAKKTMASGDVFAEGVNINKGLLALGNVIVALSNGSGGHVPYRDSKITRILKDSLGGNSKTVMLACVSPADINFEETLNTLRFSSRASCIVNNVSANRDYSIGEDGSSSSVQLIQEICILREELRMAKQQQDDTSESYSNNRVVVDLFVKLASFTRGMLVKCLEDDVEVNDEEIEQARQIIALLKKETKTPSNEEDSSGPDGLDLDFLPPIMKLVDELENLEKQITHNNRDSLESTCSDYSDCTTSTTGSSTEGICNDEVTSSEKARTLESTRSMEKMESKQLEVTHMIAMTEQCKQTISQLRKEVQRLEDDKVSAANATKPLSGTVQVKGQSEKSIQVLKEKAKLLENKQKELRKKEIEYAKLMQQKEKAFKEVTILTKELNSAKRLRVEMAKKQKEETKLHMEEKKKLVKSEHQHRKKELEAQDKASRIQRELVNKDKFMSEKLADKDREIKKLKILAEKQDNVKAQRALSRSSSYKSAQQSQFSANGHRKPIGSRSDELSHCRINELQSWIEKEVETQSSRNYLQEEIQHQMDQRSKDVRRLQALKQQNESGDVTESLDEEIKNVDEDMRARSRSIAKAQGQLADLGNVVEKRRFAKITDLREAKILLNGMFQKLSYDKLMEQRSMEEKISAQDEEIRQLKESMQKMEAIVGNGGSAPRRRKSASMETAGVADMESAGNDIPKKPKVHLKPALPHFTKKSSFKKTSDKNSHGNASDDDEDDYDFDIDESFMLDDEEDDDEDYVPENERKRSNRKRNSKEMDDKQKNTERKRSKGSDASSASDDEGPTEPFSQYTVPVLKGFLSDRSLPVSGRKDDLICRLREYISQSNSEDNSVDTSGAVDLTGGDDDVDDKENETLNEFNKLTEEIERMKSASVNSTGNSKRKLLGQTANFAPVVVEDMQGYTLE